MLVFDVNIFRYIVLCWKKQKKIKKSVFLFHFIFSFKLKWVSSVSVCCVRVSVLNPKRDYHQILGFKLDVNFAGRFPNPSVKYFIFFLSLFFAIFVYRWCPEKSVSKILIRNISNKIEYKKERKKKKSPPFRSSIPYIRINVFVFVCVPSWAIHIMILPLNATTASTFVDIVYISIANNSFLNRNCTTKLTIL